MLLRASSLPIERISASSLAKFVQCPEQWRRRYLLKEKETFGVDRFIGNVDHKTIESMFLRKIAGETLSAEQFEESYQYVWNDQLEREQDVAWGDKDKEEFYNRGLEMAQLYREQIAPRVNPIKLEEWFEEEIPGIHVPLVGKIDIETAGSIIDRKTAPNKLSSPKSGWRFQGRIYQLVAPKPMEWHITTKQKTPQIITGMESEELWMPVQNKDQTVEMVRNAYDRIVYLFNRFGADQPWPTDGTLHDWLCSYCQHGPKAQDNCVAWRR